MPENTSRYTPDEIKALITRPLANEGKRVKDVRFKVGEDDKVSVVEVDWVDQPRGPRGGPVKPEPKAEPKPESEPVKPAVQPGPLAGGLGSSGKR